MLQLLDLFSGIGGFSLGLERTGGFKTVAFCEIDPFCQKVLQKHWPDVPCFPDVTKLKASDMRTRIHAMCGGFPCQDISNAGKKKGLRGERSGLWKDYARLISELRPQVVFVENVANLLLLGLDEVLGDLAEIGYGAEWHCISASHIGAPHDRDRIWIIAYPDNGGQSLVSLNAEMAGTPPNNDRSRDTRKTAKQSKSRSAETSKASSNTHSLGCSGQGLSGRIQTKLTAVDSLAWRTSEPRIRRVDDGLSNRMDRIASLGNAVVPQIPEALGNAYLESIKCP